jgi:hypothetical protein
MHRFLKSNLMITSQATTAHEAATPASAPTAKPAGKVATTRKAPAKKASPVTAKRAPTTRKKAAPKAVSAQAQAKAPIQAKPATTQAVVKKAQAAKTKPAKEKKVKVVRDSFTIPKTEFTRIAEMKKRAMTLGVEVKKSELIRAGLQLISGLQDTAFKKALASVPTLKTGRPAKD